MQLNTELTSSKQALPFNPHDALMVMTTFIVPTEFMLMLSRNS